MTLQAGGVVQFFLPVMERVLKQPFSRALLL